MCVTSEVSSSRDVMLDFGCWGVFILCVQPDLSSALLSGVPPYSIGIKRFWFHSNLCGIVPWGEGQAGGWMEEWVFRSQEHQIFTHCRAQWIFLASQYLALKIFSQFCITGKIAWPSQCFTNLSSVRDAVGEKGLSAWHHPMAVVISVPCCLQERGLLAHCWLLHLSLLPTLPGIWSLYNK